jgi:hypothetical protein
VENNISKAIVLGHFRISDLVAQMSLCYDLLDGLLVTTKCQVKDKQTSRGGLQHLIIPDVLEIKVSDKSTLNYQVDVCVDLAEIPISGASFVVRRGSSGAEGLPSAKHRSRDLGVYIQRQRGPDSFHLVFVEGGGK